MSGSTTKLIGLLMALALIAAACSSDVAEQAAPADEAEQVKSGVVGDEESATTTSTTAPSTTTTTLGRSEFAGSRIGVTVFDHPTMNIIQAITEEFFSEPTGIEVEFFKLDNSDTTLREVITLDLGIDPYDVFFIDSRTAAQYADNGWLYDLGPSVRLDTDSNFDSLIASLLELNSVDDDLFALPLSVESSIIMYNEQIIDDAGIDFPQAPTWQQVDEIARQVDTDDTAGICLNGIPEWDQVGAALTTVVNTFDGTWWEANEDGTPGEPQINQADSGFRAATEFYLDLALDAGPEVVGARVESEVEVELGCGPEA